MARKSLHRIGAQLLRPAPEHVLIDLQIPRRLRHADATLPDQSDRLNLNSRANTRLPMGHLQLQQSPFLGVHETGSRPVLPNTPMRHGAVAANVITALMDVADDIYVVLPIGARPIFRPNSIDPGWTASTHDVVGALTKRYGYAVVSGGKGSHVKLSKPGSKPIIIPGNRAVLTPGVVKDVLSTFGKIPISKLKEFLEGKLTNV